jgi:radical SAM superfamily enzyme YgiQ (UPF0313 family)
MRLAIETSDTRETIARPEIDGVVIGEGERTLQKILDRVAATSSRDCSLL